MIWNMLLASKLLFLLSAGTLVSASPFWEGGSYRINKVLMHGGTEEKTGYRYDANESTSWSGEYVVRFALEEDTDLQNCFDAIRDEESITSPSSSSDSFYLISIQISVENHMVASFCVKKEPNKDKGSEDGNFLNVYPIQNIGGMISTEMWPSDPAVRALESALGQIVPKLNTLRVYTVDEPLQATVVLDDGISNMRLELVKTMEKTPNSAAEEGAE